MSNVTSQAAETEPTQLHCKRCNWRWSPRKTGGPPARCPSCASPRWNVAPQEIKHCLQCDYEWNSKNASGKPARCPSCGTRHWNGKPEKSIKPKHLK